MHFTVGTLALSWFTLKFTEPPRLALTLGLTPYIARSLGRAPVKHDDDDDDDHHHFPSDDLSIYNHRVKNMDFTVATDSSKDKSSVADPYCNMDIK